MIVPRPETAWAAGARKPALTARRCPHGWPGKTLLRVPGVEGFLRTEGETALPINFANTDPPEGRQDADAAVVGVGRNHRGHAGRLAAAGRASGPGGVGENALTVVSAMWQAGYDTPDLPPAPLRPRVRACGGGQVPSMYPVLASLQGAGHTLPQIAYALVHTQGDATATLGVALAGEPGGWSGYPLRAIIGVERTTLGWSLAQIAASLAPVQRAGFDGYPLAGSEQAGLQAMASGGHSADVVGVILQDLGVDGGYAGPELQADLYALGYSDAAVAHAVQYLEGVDNQPWNCQQALTYAASHDWPQTSQVAMRAGREHRHRRERLGTGRR